MRRTVLLCGVAALALVMLAPPAGAGVNNSGCPSVSSNMVLVTSYWDGYQRSIAEAAEAGVSLEDIAAFYGIAPEAVWPFYLSLIQAIDKNGDGMYCVHDYWTGWGFAKKQPWVSNVVDNVLPH